MRKQLELLGLSYVDLFLIHWPAAVTKDENGNVIMDKIPVSKTWGDFENLKELGLTKSIGVSNFSIQLLWDLLTYCNVPPAVNEIELHPYLA